MATQAGTAAKTTAKTAAKAAAKKKKSTDNRPRLTTRAELYRRLGTAAGLSQRQVHQVFEAYRDLAITELGRKGPGVILLPLLARLKATRIPATRGQVKPNPFRPGELMTVRAKPPRIRLKIAPLKAFKGTLA